MCCFKKENLSCCAPGMHPTEICYNSSFIYDDLMFPQISRNLTPAKNKGLLYYTQTYQCHHILLKLDDLQIKLQKIFQ